MLLIMLAMGVSLITTGVVTWVDSKAAAATVAEARTMDLFRAVRRSLRDAVNEDRADLSGLREDFDEAGLRYVAVMTRDGDVIKDAGEPCGVPLPRSRFDGPAEPRPEVVADRLRLDAPLAQRPGGRGRGLRLVIEVDPVLARSLEHAARNQLIVSGAVSLALILLSFVFWRLGRRADQLEALRAHDRRLAALGEMSAVLGHELRNPLASLKGHAQLVLERMGEGERSRKNAERVVAEAIRLERLMGQILEFARTGTLEVAEGSPLELVKAAIEKAADPRIAVESSRAPERWRFDRARMEQVLVNLLSNAAEATPEGGRIEVSVSTSTQSRRLVIGVRDTGPGFEPDADGTVSHVFEPFRTTGKIYGTGLGLAIARRIVIAHGGTIRAENVAGGGALVVIELP
jgi:two-component system sensor histidine kinase HydH